MRGPPSGYKPEYCDAVMQHCAEGGSITSFAGVVGVTKRTLVNWQGSNPEFADACEIARLKALALSEKAHWALAIEGGKTSGLEYRMGNLSGWEWRLKTSTEVTGKDDGPLQTVQRVERYVIDPKN